MSWKRVCSTDDVMPNTLARFVVDDIAILVANLGDGFSAFPPACPHMQEPLERSGVCSDARLTCTKHLWQWNMRDGSAEGPPENDRTLLRYDVRVEDDAVHVRIESELEYEYDDDGDDDFEW